jgi:hypothetical protein
MPAPPPGTGVVEATGAFDDAAVARDELAAMGEALAAASAFDFLNHECLPGEGDAAVEPLAVAVIAAFFECLCLAGLGDAPGLGLEVAV